MYPPPDAIRRVDDLIKIDFQGLRDSYFAGVLWSAFAVFLGVALEGPEALKEAIGTVSRTLIPRGRGLTPALHITHNALHRFSRSIAQLSLVGWIIVAGGLASEGVFEALVARADGILQTFNNILLTDALGRTANAESNLAGALISADSARALAMGFQAQIAGARTDAASAKAQAAASDLARVKIEERLAGWKLDSAAQKRLVDKLMPFSGTHFDLVVNPVETSFMETLDGLLISAGWIRQIPKDSSGQPQIILLSNKAAIFFASGITVEIPQDRFSFFRGALTAFVEGLRAEGIPAKANAVTLPGFDPTALHIGIGKRE